MILIDDARLIIGRLYPEKLYVDERLKPSYSSIKALDKPTEKEREEGAKAMKEKILNPYKSNNIYKEFNIQNLVKMYERALKDIDDFLLFFGIHNKEDAETAFIDAKIT